MSSEQTQSGQRYQEDNPKMKEIFDILLLAGYFRIRIPSINAFDKMVGGLAWCIACSNFEVDIEYNEDMNLGQKIKVAEKICQALKKMKCPFDLQPFQIQGLDFNKIFPIIQWLIKFVYETREQRKDFNKDMSNFVGKKVYKYFDEKDKQDRQIMIETSSFIKTSDKRLSKNNKIKNLSRKDPLRIYSSLIEYGDLTAIKTYNKLCALISGKVSLNEGGQAGGKAGEQGQGAMKKSQNLQKKEGGKQDDPTDLSSGNFIDAEKQLKLNMNELLFHASNTINQGTPSDSKSTTGQGQGNSNKKSDSKQNNNQQNSEQINVDDFKLDEDQQGTFKTLDKVKGNKVGEYLSQLMHDNQDKINESLKQAEKDGADEFEFAKIISNEKEFHQTQVQAIKKRIIQLEKELEELSDELYGLKEEDEKLTNETTENTNIYKQLQDTAEIIQQKIDAVQKKNVNKKEIEEAEQLVLKKSELEEKKTMLRKEIKTQIQELTRQKEKTEKEIPQFDDNYIQSLQKDIAQKKEKYDTKFKDLANLNQELAVLQRKMESYPSPTEIAQYHQRFLELLDNINQEMEKQRDHFIFFNNLQDVKNMVLQFVEIMRTFKENYLANKKSKSGRENFIEELRQTYTQLSQNLQKSQEILKKQETNKQLKQSTLSELQQLEREYYQILKELTMEFEIGEAVMQQLKQ